MKIRDLILVLLLSFGYSTVVFSKDPGKQTVVTYLSSEGYYGTDTQKGGTAIADILEGENVEERFCLTGIFDAAKIIDSNEKLAPLNLEIRLDRRMVGDSVNRLTPSYTIYVYNRTASKTIEGGVKKPVVIKNTSTSLIDQCTGRRRIIRNSQWQ